MSEQQIPTPPPAPDTDPEVAALHQRIADLEAESALLAEAVKANSDKPVRYAVYDNERERFLGPVYDKRPTKAVMVALIKLDASTTDDYDQLDVIEV